MLLRSRLILVGFIASALTACGQNPATLPDPPAPIHQPDRYAWGDAVASREEHLLGTIDASLRPRFGQPSEQHFIAPARTDFAALRRWYEGRASGWVPLPSVENSGRHRSGHAFGFSHGDDAFVLVWLDPQGESGNMPVTIQRYGAGRADISR